MDLNALLRLAHAVAGVTFVAGLIGFWIVRGMASRADSLATMQLLLRTAVPFARMLSISGITLTLFGLATAVSTGRPIFGPLQGGRVDWMFASTLLMLPIFAFLTVIYPRFGRRLRTALAGAEPEGRVTPEIVAAWADPSYRFARRYDLVAALVVLILMLAKPF